MTTITDELAAAVRMIEFGNYDDCRGYRCPCCYGPLKGGHTSSCEVRKTLAKYEAAKAQETEKGFPVVKVPGHVVNHMEWRDHALIVIVGPRAQEPSDLVKRLNDFADRLDAIGEFFDVDHDKYNQNLVREAANRIEALEAEKRSLSAQVPNRDDAALREVLAEEHSAYTGMNHQPELYRGDHWMLKAMRRVSTLAQQVTEQQAWEILRPRITGFGKDHGDGHFDDSCERCVLIAELDAAIHTEGK